MLVGVSGQPRNLSVGQPRPEILDQAALARARFGADGNNGALAVPQSLQGALQKGHLHATTDEIRSQTGEAARGAGTLAGGNHLVDPYRLRFAFDLDRGQFLEGVNPFHQGVRLLAEEDFPGFGEVGESRGHVDGVADHAHRALFRFHLAGDHQTGVDAGVCSEGAPDPPLNLWADRLHYLVDFAGGPDRPHGVVLMRYRHTEQRHQRIPNVLFYGAPVFGYHPCRLAEDPPHDLLHLLRIKLFHHGGIAGKVAKEHRGLAPFAFGMWLGGRFCGGGRAGKVKGAIVAKFRACGILLLAFGTDHGFPPAKILVVGGSPYGKLVNQANQIQNNAESGKDVTQWRVRCMGGINGREATGPTGRDTAGVWEE